MYPNGDKSGSVLSGYVIYGGEQSDDHSQASIWGAPHIHRPQIFKGLRREPHLFPCSSIHCTTVFCIGGFPERTQEEGKQQQDNTSPF